MRLGPYQLAVGGDIITGIDGQPTTDLKALAVHLETETAIGDTVELTVLRGGRDHDPGDTRRATAAIVWCTE